MQLNKKAIDEYKKIFLDEEGILLTDEKANERAVHLLKLMKFVYRPIPIASRLKK